jgi:hypothetical protein
MRKGGVATRRASLFVSVSLAILGGATIASAQGAPLPPPSPAVGAPAMKPLPTAVAPAPGPMPTAPSGPADAQPLPSSPPGATGYPPPGYPPAMMFGPSRLPYNDGEPVPPGYEIQTRPRMGMAKAGIATLVPLYGLSALFGATYLGREDGAAQAYAPLLIPVIGPFATMGTAGTAEFGTTILALNGLGQLAGAALLIAGLLTDEQYLARRRAGLDIRPEVSVGPRSVALRWQF